MSWNESRIDEGFFLVMGEWSGHTWEFWERDSWEVRWYQIPSTCGRIAIAKKLAKDKFSTPKEGSMSQCNDVNLPHFIGGNPSDSCHR